MLRKSAPASRPQENMKLSAIGHHWLIELYDCDADLLETTDFVENALLEAALAMGATIVQSNFHQFTPVGVSGVVIIQESHLTIHTWPEHGYAAVDIFTCGKSLQPELGLQLFQERLHAKRTEMQYIQRGIVNK